MNIMSITYSHYVWIGIKCLNTIYECNMTISSEVFLAILFEKKVIHNLFKGLRFALNDRSAVVGAFIIELVVIGRGTILQREF